MDGILGTLIMYQLTNSQSLVIRTTDGSYIPADPENTDWQTYQQWLADGNTPDAAPAPTITQLIAANTSALQAEMDRQAAEKNYDNIVSACSYAAQPVGAPFQAEGAAFLAWRSDVWVRAYATLAQVQAGTATMPTPQEAVAQMPPLVLPT